jgi:hypothetical protein
MRLARSTDPGPRGIIAAGRGWSGSSISTTITTAMVGIITDIGWGKVIGAANIKLRGRDSVSQPDQGGLLH